MSHKLAAALLATATLALTAPAAWAAVPAYVTAAVADPGRPETDTKRDADRKPAEMLVFAGVKPGDTVVDFATGAPKGGYFAKLFAAAVGPQGQVYAYEPAEFVQFYKSGVSANASQPDPKRPNLTFLTMPINSFAPPQKVDLVWTAQNYHDFHDDFSKPADLALVNKAIYAALKPGGTYIVLDHSAADGSGLRDTDSLHRIDAAQVRKEVEAAGFKFVAESKVLRNPADDRAKNVFDPAIKGHTDQFIYKFRKPM